MLSQQWDKLMDVTCDFCGVCFSNRFLAFPLSKSRILPNLEILPFLRYFYSVFLGSKKSPCCFCDFCDICGLLKSRLGLFSF